MSAFPPVLEPASGSTAPRSEELIQVEGIAVLGRNKQRLMGPPANHWDWSIPGNPFTQGWRIGDLVFVGGQISADANARTVGEGMAVQTRNVFGFGANTLREAGLDESDVVKINSYYHADGSTDSGSPRPRRRSPKFSRSSTPAGPASPRRQCRLPVSRMRACWSRSRRSP